MFYRRHQSQTVHSQSCLRGESHRHGSLRCRKYQPDAFSGPLVLTALSHLTCSEYAPRMRQAVAGCPVVGRVGRNYNPRLFQARQGRTWGFQDQDQDSLLVKRRNDNHSPGPVIRELVPSSHQRSELSNTILCIFSE